MNPLDLSPAEFQDFLTEERQYRSPEQIDDLIRRYNAANSLSGRLAGLLEPQDGRRRTSILPASVPVGMSLMEALQSGEAEFAIPQGIVDMVTGTVRGVENPTLAAQGRIPASDMNAAGFESAASAMGLAGLLGTKPAGSLGAFYGREGGSVQDALELAKSGRGIFHSSQADQFDEINKYGVEPQYGPWVKEVAEGATDNPSFLDDMPMAAWWSEQPDWVKMKTARAAGKNVNDVTVDDIRKYGHLSIADADEYADTVYRIPEEGIEYEGSEVSNLSGERMPLYATDLYEYGDDGVGRYPFGIERNELVTRESVEPKYSLTGQELVDFLKQYDGDAVSTNVSEGYDGYLSRVNPSGTRIAAEDRPNLMMGDMYGMLPRGSDIIGEKGDVTFYRSPDGDYYATAYNPDVGEQDVIGYIMGRGDSTELQVVSEMQGQGIGGELQYLFRSENPDAPTGGLTEAGERALERTYDRLFDAGLVSANASKTSGFMGQLLNADDIPAKTESQKVAKRILELRSQGRANEVTEEMMEDADPRTMAAYTPLDMSTKARMERAGLLGFKPEEVSIHGAMDNPERFTFDSDITPVYTSDNPAIANTYTAGEDSAMFDLLVKQGPSDDVADQINNLRQKALDVDVQGASYAAISPDFKDKTSGNTLENFFDVYLYPENRGESVQHLVDGETVVGPVTSTDQIAYAMRDEGVPHARIENVLDRGPYSPRAWPIGGMDAFKTEADFRAADKAIREWERSMQDASRKPSTDQITFDEGGRLRSRFARFDPEFSHLKNLTAANASPLVGLLTQGLSEKQANKIEDYLYRTGLLQ
jgi:hypothetical protein